MPPPDQPRRGRPPVTSEPNVSRGPHTPVPPPEARGTAPPPAPMPMAPPRHLAAPRARLDSHRGEATMAGVAPPAERRPDPVNPPPPESMRPPVADRATELPAGQVVLGKGKWAMSMPNAVAMALIACLGGALTAWINKPQPGDPAQIAKAIQAATDVANAELAKQNKALLDRVDGSETKSARLQGAIDSLLAMRLDDRLSAVETKIDRVQQSQDALRDRVNDRLAK